MPRTIHCRRRSIGGRAGGRRHRHPAGFGRPFRRPGRFFRPDALALWYPVLDNGPDGYGDAAFKARCREFSPLHNVSAGTPPALVFIGTKDAAVPVQTIRSFERRMTEAGKRCQVKVVEGGRHPRYSYREGPSAVRDRLLPQCHAFLRSIGVF